VKIGLRGIWNFESKWWFNDDNCYEVLGRRYGLFPLEIEVGLDM